MVEWMIGGAVGIVISLDEREKKTGASLDNLLALIRPDLERTNQLIIARMGSDVTTIPEVANHLISAGGKRLRPMLVLATAGMCGYKGDGHLKFAAGIEFMHTATLLHDDVVDESDMRRGKIAARMLWGNETCVLVGDFLLGHAFKMMVEPGNLPCLSVVSSAAAVIAEGEIMQLNAAKDTQTTEDAYMEVIRRKTAELFAAAAEVGVILAGRPKADKAAARSYGMKSRRRLSAHRRCARLRRLLGEARQERRRRFPRRQDHAAGRARFRRGSEKEREFWRRTLEKGEIKDGDVDTACGLMKKHKALDDTIERATHYAAIARDAMRFSRPRRRKSALLEVLDFCIERVN